MISTIKKIVIHAAIAALALISVNTSDVYAAGKNAKFNVTFIYGTTINTQQVKRGKDAIVPVDTFVPGFTFAGWTDTAANIQSDKIILGMYTPTKSAVTASTTPTQNGIGGKAIKLNNNVSAPALPWWDMSLKGVPGKTCVVRWYNGHNGELWKTDVVPYGTTLDDPGNPCLHGYDFVGWEGSWENITEDRNIRLRCNVRRIARGMHQHLRKLRTRHGYRIQTHIEIIDDPGAHQCLLPLLQRRRGQRTHRHARHQRDDARHRCNRTTHQISIHNCSFFDRIHRFFKRFSNPCIFQHYSLYLFPNAKTSPRAIT